MISRHLPTIFFKNREYFYCSSHILLIVLMTYGFKPVKKSFRFFAFKEKNSSYKTPNELKKNMKMMNSLLFKIIFL